MDPAVSREGSIVAAVNVIGFEVVTVVVMKSSVFYDIELCSPLKADQRFAGKTLSCWFLTWLIRRP
jgi:hypothetical protein